MCLFPLGVSGARRWLFWTDVFLFAMHWGTASMKVSVMGHVHCRLLCTHFLRVKSSRCHFDRCIQM